MVPGGKKPREKGDRFEREVQHRLEHIGWHTTRRPGSKFPDLIAIKKGTILLIECKMAGYLNPEERKELVRQSKQIGAIPVLASKEARIMNFTLVQEKKEKNRKKININDASYDATTSS